MLGLVTLSAAIPAMLSAFRHTENVHKLFPFMGMNVLINIATQVLMTAGMLVS